MINPTAGLLNTHSPSSPKGKIATLSNQALSGNQENILLPFLGTTNTLVRSVRHVDIDHDELHKYQHVHEVNTLVI